MTGDDPLRAALERMTGATIARFDRRPSPYRTSFVLDEIDLELDDGRRLELIFKHISRDALHPAAADVKPEFLHDPLREIEVYRDVLAPAGLGTPAFVGADPERGWLFLERVDGVELYQVGERRTWEHVARWLARMHDRFAAADGAAPHAIRYDAQWYRRWPERAVRVAAARDDAESLAILRGIADRYEHVVERLLALPTTLVHGEFYASNVLVDDAHEPRRVAPVDWEQAGVGPGLVDLAALTSGDWSEEDRGHIAAAYRDASAGGLDEESFDAGLEACRLHLALQWLGWSGAWSPPVEHRQDWLREARQAGVHLG